MSVPMSRSRASSPNGSSTSPNMIAMLEARIAQLENILGLDSSGDLNIEANKIMIRGTRVTIESSSKMVFKSYGDLSLEGMTVEVRANSGLNLNANNTNLNATNLNFSASFASISAAGSLELTGGSVASLSGTITKIGKGLLPVATSSVSVSAAGLSLSSTIASPNVLA